jgi:hypothetical protein
MTKRRPWIWVGLITLAAFLIATGLKQFLVNPLTMPKPRLAAEPSCWNSAEAKARGLWLCDVRVKGMWSKPEESADIREAWVEKGSIDDYFLVWFPYQRKLPYNLLCFLAVGEPKTASYTFSAETLPGFGRNRPLPGGESRHWAKLALDDFGSKEVTVTLEDFDLHTARKIGTIRFLPQIPNP